MAGGSQRSISVFESDLRFNAKFTFGVKLDGVTVGLTDAPRAVEDRSSLCNVDLRRVGLGSSDHHAGAADKAKKKQQKTTSCESTAVRRPATGY